jgi:hypothetical protein
MGSPVMQALVNSTKVISVGLNRLQHIQVKEQSMSQPET